MSDVICQVSNRGDRVEVIWSSLGGFFEPYTIAGPRLAELRRAADRPSNGPPGSDKPSCREALEVLVSALNQAGSEAPPWQPAYELAEAGFRLYNHLLPPEDETAKKVRRWLEELRKQSPLIGLEVVFDERSADPSTFLSIPWNLVYDERPSKHKAAFEAGEGVERWRPFWSARYNLTSGRRVEPLKRMPNWVAPRVIVVVDPTVRAGLREDQRERLDGFLREVGLEAVGSMAALESALEEGYPRLLYWLGHATPEYLMLGDDRIVPGDLRDLLRGFDDRERPEGMIAFLNACQTAEVGSGGSFLDVLHGFGFAGAIATERQTIDTFANEFGLAFLRGFLIEGKPLGELLHGLRLESAPLGLLYGAHCPPEIRVRPSSESAPEPMPIREVGPVAGMLLGAVAAPASTSTLPPLPDRPYRSLGFYDEADIALFTGRDADVSRFAATLDLPETRILILHGESGTGKSSFLRAGLIPYLERQCVGYRFLRGPDGSAPIVQAANDPVGQIAQALLDATSSPLSYDTPDGRAHRVDLGGILDDAVGAKADHPGLRAALMRDPRVLADILSRMAGAIPFALVLVLDQAEEVFTLARSPEEIAGRDHALRMLRRLLDIRADVKLIVSMRTEYYGRWLDHLRDGRRDLVGVRDDLLRDFTRSALIDAIKRPASAKPLALGQPSPRDHYGLRYADGVPERIADDVLRLRSENRDGVLPLAQVICTQLYDREITKPDMDGVITLEDLDAIKGVEGGLRAFAEDALARSMGLGPGDRVAFQGLFARLYNRQADGTLTTWLMARDALERQWRRPMPFGAMLEAAKAVRLLREDELRIEGDQPRRYVRLGHDALAKVAMEWDDERRRRARRRKLVAALAGSLALAGVMSLLSILAWRSAAVARAQRREAQVIAAGLALDRGQALCERGDLTGGLLTMARALAMAPGDAVDLGEVIRANLGAWAPRARRLRRIFPHEVAVVVAAFSTDGRFVVSAGKDGVAQRWDVESGKALGPPMKHPDRVCDLAVSRDGRWIVTACLDGSARVWDVETSREVGKPLTHPAPVFAVAISPDDRLVLTGCDDSLGRLWDLQTRQPVGEPMVHANWVRAVAFSPDGSLAVTASWDATVRFWDRPGGKPASRPTIQFGTEVRSVAFAPDGRSLLVGGMGPMARVYSADGQMTREFGPHPGPVFGVAFSPDGAQAVTGTADGTARVWDVGTGRPVGSPLKHQGWVGSVAFSPGGDAILTASGDRSARLWSNPIDPAGGRTLVHGGAVYDAVFTPDDRTAITTASDGLIRRWDVASGVLIGEPWSGGGAASQCLALRPDGTTLLMASGNDLVARDARTMLPLPIPAMPHPSAVNSVVLSGDGKRAATSCVDQTTRVWDVADGRLVGLISHASRTFNLDYAVDGSTLLVGLLDGTTRLWDARTFRPQGPAERHPDDIEAIALAPDGRTHATGCDDRTVRLWTPGRAVRSIRTDSILLAIAFDPKRGSILAGGIDGVARLWDPATLRPIGATMRHDAGLTGARFSHDGRTILTGGFDRAARLWDAPPPPLRGDPADIARWMEGLTGSRLIEDGSIDGLEVDAWRERARSLPDSLKAPSGGAAR